MLKFSNNNNIDLMLNVLLFYTSDNGNVNLH